MRRLLVLLAKRLGDSSMVDEVFGGLILSQLLLNILSAGLHISLFIDFGIIVIMFHSGLFTDLSSFRSQKVISIVVGALGVAVSFLFIFCLTLLIDTVRTGEGIERSGTVLGEHHRHPDDHRIDTCVDRIVQGRMKDVHI